MKATLIRNLQLGYGISLLLLIISSIASYFSITNLLTSSKLVDHTNIVILKLESCLSLLKDAETGQRGYLLTNDSVFLEPYNGAYIKTLNAINEVKELSTDNPEQQKRVIELKQLAINRLDILDKNIKLNNSRKIIDVANLKEGKRYMDLARKMVREMENVEAAILKRRTATMNAFADYTPILVVAASLLSLLITLFSYRKVSSDLKIREELQRKLVIKDKETSTRIHTIQDIADKIAQGDYATRLTDLEKDGLGNLSGSLNRMAGSLQLSFNLLSDKEWMQTGIAMLSAKMVGEKDLSLLTNDVINVATLYTNSQVGALYLLESDILNLYGQYSLPEAAVKSRLKLGEGLIGQCALSGKQIILKDIPEGNLNINFAFGEAKPANIIAFPILHDSDVKGVVVLASLTLFTERVLEFLTTISSNIGSAVNGAQNRVVLQQLFEETQAQTEELQVQHSELEHTNTELEFQTHKLQASEEELRVQQEELMQANQELEERSHLLEEKNQLIVERNLDIQRKAEELELSSKYKSEFLANMSHELRTPLNSILLLSRLMGENNDKNLNSDQVESAKVIQSSGNGLLTLIDEILDLSKIEAGKMELEYGTVSIKSIADNMKSLFAPIAKEKNLDFIIEIADIKDQIISTDQLRLEQILKNLLSNALKFTAKGTVKLSITSASETDDLIAFSVKDTGLGIPQNKQKLIFEAFQQADGSTKRKFGGTGLGLSISRELAKLLGGEIYLTSAPGEGSEFKAIIPKSKRTVPVILPVHNASAESEVKIVAEVVESARYRSEIIPADIADDRENLKAGDKIMLIVEDDTNFAKALLNFTNKRGYKGIVSVRGDIAVDLALRYMPSAILLDIHLPIKDGWEIMEELKADPKLRHIPVHIMSSVQAKKESISKGAVDFINKPFAMEQMQQVFQKLEEALQKGPKKVLIVEENPQHAKALAYFLETFNIAAEIKDSVNEGVSALKDEKIDCVILDMGIPDQNGYQTLETVKKNPGLENLPIIIFTGKNLSKAEENRIKQYADSIVVKTAHSYQRILDEITLFLHLVEENKDAVPEKRMYKLGEMTDVLKGKTVLIADDDVRNIFSLTRSLEQHKMVVISAMDGKEALSKLQENPDINIVLMDMMMPEMDGYESTALIRQQPKFKNLPILAVTAKAMVGDREKCIQAGASDYISKPVDIDQLVSLLRVWLYDKV